MSIEREGNRRLSRRVFLRGAAGSAAVALLAACGSSARPTKTPAPVPATTKESLPNDAAFQSAAVASPTAGSAPVIEAVSNDVVGALFAMTNNNPNAVVMYLRLGNGELDPVGSFRTGGVGIGDTSDGGALDSQGGLALSQNGNWLFAVNAGSGDISTFAVRGEGLQLTDRIGSRGPRPISVTVRGNLVYVLNYNRFAAGNGNITAFTLGSNGRLTPLANSARSLSTNGAVNPGQVLFSPGGNVLAVSEKATNRIVTYTVGNDGLANGPFSHGATGQTPFGLAFNSRGVLVSANAVNDAAGAGSASSYIVSSAGGASPVGGAVGSRQTATCWVAIDRNGNYAYFVNALGNSLSGFQIGGDGRLLPLNGGNPVARTDTKPFDIAISSDNRHLYVLNAGAGTISGYGLLQGGGLSYLGVTGRVLPIGANGLVVI